MPIYNIFEMKETLSKQTNPEVAGLAAEPEPSARDRFFSSLAARLFFLLLLVADVLWGIYAMVLFCCVSALSVLSACRWEKARKGVFHYWISIKRALVCGLSLLIALFSPAFGIMIACTYFLMYDKAGIEEVVPSSLQEQFKEFFKEAP